MAGVGEDVEGLCLDVGVVQGYPFQVLLGQLGVGRVAGILANGVDGFRAILGLLGTGNGGQARHVLGCEPQQTHGQRWCRAGTCGVWSGELTSTLPN